MSDTKRIQLRLSEGIRARMAVDFRQSGCRSWDEFFALLLAKWEGQGEAIPESRVLKELHQVRSFLEHSASRVEILCLLEESHGEDLHVLQTGQEQLAGQVQRLVGLLALALGVGEPTGHASSPRQPPPSVAAESRGAEVLRKIRHRQLP
ncbi:MAG: hypothetical protein IT578_03385 [Verrucomicrobiae bacterium]|nr:hypothetical protein [Verrucomicrobiae bacterium]